MKGPVATTLNDAEYEAIEHAIAATRKGRAFLRRRDSVARVIGTEQVLRAIRRLQDQVADGRPNPAQASLDLIHRELAQVQAHIDRTKVEIGQLVADTPDAPIKGAAAELDEIVSCTDRATHTILGAAEKIGFLADELPADAAQFRDTIAALCIEIFQACSFQDITGQRIAKVVKTLSYVEARVNAMLAIGDRAHGAEAGTDPARPQPSEDQALLHGPQLPGHGLEQDAIDLLLRDMPAEPAASPQTLGQGAIDQLFA